MTEPNENQSSLCFDLRVRIAALADEWTLTRYVENGIAREDIA